MKDTYIVLIALHPLTFYCVCFWKAWPHIAKVGPKKLSVKKRLGMLREVVLDVGSKWTL